MLKARLPLMFDRLLGAGGDPGRVGLEAPEIVQMLVRPDEDERGPKLRRVPVRD